MTAEEEEVLEFTAIENDLGIATEYLAGRDLTGKWRRCGVPVDELSRYDSAGLRKVSWRVKRRTMKVLRCN